MSPATEEAAFDRAAALTAAGDLAGARTILRRLGDQADQAGEAVVASRALRLAATLDRALGDPNDAVANARRAVAWAETAGDDDLAAAAHAELGESLIRLGRVAEGAAAYGIAADRATSERQSAAFRRMESFAAQPRPDMTDAARLLRDAQQAVEAAGIATQDAAIDLAFVAATAALDGHDLPRALAEVRAARQLALQRSAVLPYIAAAVAESAIAEIGGDDRAAYGSLATGYATLGDVVGKRLSAATFEGPLVRLRERWGPPRFARAKAAYERERRRVGPR